MSRLKYLLNKEKVSGLDKAERYELLELIQRQDKELQNA